MTTRVLRDLSNTQQQVEDEEHRVQKSSQKQTQSLIKDIIASKISPKVTDTSLSAYDSDVSSMADMSFGDLSTLSWSQKQFDILFGPGAMGFHMEPIYKDDYNQLGCKIKEINPAYYPEEDEGKQQVCLI